MIRVKVAGGNGVVGVEPAALQAATAPGRQHRPAGALRFGTSNRASGGPSGSAGAAHRLTEGKRTRAFLESAG